jgi:hypothetical protein
MGLLGYAISLKASVAFQELTKDRILDMLAMSDICEDTNSAGTPISNAYRTDLQKVT